MLVPGQDTQSFWVMSRSFPSDVQWLFFWKRFDGERFSKFVLPFGECFETDECLRSNRLEDHGMIFQVQKAIPNPACFESKPDGTEGTIFWHSEKVDLFLRTRSTLKSTAAKGTLLRSEITLCEHQIPQITIDSSSDTHVRNSNKQSLKERVRPFLKTPWLVINGRFLRPPTTFCPAISAASLALRGQDS